ncbi:hypothetical protein SprV_0501842100 [Sparganum proliferum]
MPTRCFRRRSAIFQNVQRAGSSFEFLDSWEDSMSDTVRSPRNSLIEGSKKSDISAYLARMREKSRLRIQLPPLEQGGTGEEQKKRVTFTPRQRSNKPSKWSAVRPSVLRRRSPDEMEFEKIISTVKKVDRRSSVMPTLPRLPLFLEAFRDSDWLKATDCFSAPDWPQCPTGQSPDAFVTCYVNAALIRRLVAFEGDTPACQLFVDLLELHSTSPLSEETCAHVKRVVLGVFIEDADLSWQPKIRVLVFLVRLLIRMGATDVDTFALLLHCIAVVKVHHFSDKVLRTTLCQSLEEAGVPDTRGFLSDELRDMLDVQRILVPHTVDHTEQGKGETLSLAETHSSISFLRKWLFHWIVEAKLKLKMASSGQPDNAEAAENIPRALTKKAHRVAHRQKSRRTTLQEKVSPNAIDAIRTFYSWKEEKGKVTLDEVSDEASEKTVVPQKAPRKPKEPVCRTIVTTKTRTVSGKLPECVGFHDASRPAFANPWRSYCQAMLSRLPPMLHFRPPMVTPMPFEERRERLESLSKDIDRVRQQVASLVYWFLPELSRVLPCLLDGNSAAADLGANTSTRWTVNQKRVSFLRGAQSRLALSMELDG